MEWMLIILAALAVLAIMDGRSKSKATKKAYLDYQISLGKLKDSPRSANLRQETLRLGRAYSHLIRDKKGQTVFDEVALMNDITAACGGAGSAETEPLKTVVSSQDTIEVRLQKLQSLRDRNLIDDAEYRSLRQDILNTV